MGRWSRAVGKKFLAWFDPKSGRTLGSMWAAAPGHSPSSSCVDARRPRLPASIHHRSRSTTSASSSRAINSRSRTPPRCRSTAIRSMSWHPRSCFTSSPDRAKALAGDEARAAAGQTRRRLHWKRTQTTDFAAYAPCAARRGARRRRGAALAGRARRLDGGNARLAHRRRLRRYRSGRDRSDADLCEFQAIFGTRKRSRFRHPGKTIAKLDDAQRAMLRDLLRETLTAADGTIT